jgi:hypothetical protein
MGALDKNVNKLDLENKYGTLCILLLKLMYFDTEFILKLPLKYLFTILKMTNSCAKIPSSPTI